MTHPLTTFSSVIHLSTSRTADPASVGIDRFVRLEHIEPENLHIRSWGLVADGTTFTSTFKRGQVLFAKRCAIPRVGFTRLPRTEAGLYPAVYSIDEISSGV